MNKKMMLALSMAFVMIFGVCGMAFARGGGPDPGGCESKPIPPPDAGFFLRGEFTVSLYPDTIFGSQSIVHIFLKKGNQTELFNYIASSDVGTRPLCDATVEVLLEEFKYVPCRLDVAGVFGLPGVGVITNIEILQTDNCGLPDEMMRGEIVIRVVPPPKTVAK